MRIPIFLAVFPVFLATSCQDLTSQANGPDNTNPSFSALTVSPSGLPDQMLLGLFETPGATWMKNSGVPWNARYAYFTKGWVNNWGWSAYDGSWALDYMKECDGLGTVPVIEFYQMNSEAGGGEAQFWAKTQDAATMKGYFGDFKILMQRAKDFGKPVYVEVEADGLGFLYAQTGANPNAAAAVASTGLPELASLPNTVAGWGMAFLALKKSAGATNVFLGMHIAGWCTGKDLIYWDVTAPLQPEIDKLHAFLRPLGLSANATGLTYDAMVSDPGDRDADWYRLVVGNGGNSWWDTSATAPISSRSFNRYREWLRLWYVATGKPWLLWQIPLGNSNHLNVYNNGGPREGYKDNRPEYFLGPNGMAHCRAFADAGVIALLFGAGAQGVSSFGNDIYFDGKSFMQSRGAAFFAAGGVGLAGSGGTGGGGTGGTPGGGTPSGARVSLPGRIQAEDYKTGGEGIGYHDLTLGNSGGQYRTDNVDIEAAGDAGGGYGIGWIEAGEWLAYDVNVAQSGNYSLTLRLASASVGTKAAIVSVDGRQVASLSTADASGWQSWKSLTANRVKLSAGNHVIRVTMSTGGFNLNWIEVAAR